MGEWSLPTGVETRLRVPPVGSHGSPHGGQVGWDGSSGTHNPRPSASFCWGGLIDSVHSGSGIQLPQSSGDIPA